MSTFLIPHPRDSYTWFWLHVFFPLRGFMIALDTPQRTSDRPDTQTTTWQHAQHSQETSMPPAIFEPAIPESERPQTHTLDRSATGIGQF